MLSPRAAFRRLSSVETDSGASHQREFHAIALHRRFGFRSGRTSGRLLALYWPSNADIQFDETDYTLYDARRPPRSEYHLYPATRLFIDEANAGDLVVVFRTKKPDDLCIVVAERGGPAEAGLLAAYFPDGAPPLERFVFSDSESDAESSSEIMRTLNALACALGFELQ
jgi:hypothetical protein